MTSSELIFVTGASGFLASHIVEILLDKGYRVRGTARGAKVERIKNAYAQYGSLFEVVEVLDVATGDFAAALKGVTTVIHTAAPLPTSGDADTIRSGAFDGTENVLEQVGKASIKKFIYTSSLVTALDPTNGTFSDKVWCPITEESAPEMKTLGTYIAAKTAAEKKVWEFADNHPHIDVTTLNGPHFYGSFVPGTIPSEPDYSAFSTNSILARILRSDGIFNIMAPGYVDVRDLAQAHVAALSGKPTSTVGRKRLLFSSPHALDYGKAIELIAEKRPFLRGRLADPAKAPVWDSYVAQVDWKRIEDVIGFKTDAYRSWEDTVLDTVDALIAVENEWKNSGFEVEFPNDP